MFPYNPRKKNPQSLTGNLLPRGTTTLSEERTANSTPYEKREDTRSLGRETLFYIFIFQAPHIRLSILHYILLKY